MSLLNKENKDKLIGGVIGVVLIGLTLFVKSLFSKEEKPANINTANSNTKQEQTISSHDSSQQKVTSNKVEQDNSNSGDVNTDIISGNKNINNYIESPKKGKPSSEPVQKIENNGGFVNINGTNNTYNQTINPKPKPRSISKADKQELLTQIPKDFQVELTYCWTDQECNTYGSEILAFLQSESYSVTSSLVGILAGRMPKERLDLELLPESKTARLFIHPQRP